MQSSIKILAAGSLKYVLPDIIKVFQVENDIEIVCEFGPAGILREHIEKGKACDLFLSANEFHAQSLLDQNIAHKINPFILSSLCITTQKKYLDNHPDWKSLLLDQTLSIGASTPICDPCGDYVVEFLGKIESSDPDIVKHIHSRLQYVVGGKTQIVSVPKGEVASKWLVSTGVVDIFIGYAHYKNQIMENDLLTVLSIPQEFNINACYTSALIHDNAFEFEKFLQSKTSQDYFLMHGFTLISV